MSLSVSVPQNEDMYVCTTLCITKINGSIRYTCTYHGILDTINRIVCIGYKNIPVSIDDAPKAVQGERNVVTTISARSAQRI